MLDTVDRILSLGSDANTPLEYRIPYRVYNLLLLIVSAGELLSNLVFEFCWSCGDLAGFGGFNTVFERDACDDFGEVVKAA